MISEEQIRSRVAYQKAVELFKLSRDRIDSELGRATSEARLALNQRMLVAELAADRTDARVDTWISEMQQRGGWQRLIGFGIRVAQNVMGLGQPQSEESVDQEAFRLERMRALSDEIALIKRGIEVADKFGPTTRPSNSMDPLVAYRPGIHSLEVVKAFAHEYSEEANLIVQTIADDQVLNNQRLAGTVSQREVIERDLINYGARRRIAYETFSRGEALPAVRLPNQTFEGKLMPSLIRPGKVATIELDSQEYALAIENETDSIYAIYLDPRMAKALDVDFRFSVTDGLVTGVFAANESEPALVARAVEKTKKEVHAREEDIAKNDVNKKGKDKELSISDHAMSAISIASALLANAKKHLAQRVEHQTTSHGISISHH